MKINSEAKPYDDINITPMLDLAFVLLVIFIIMTTASVQGIKVNLPKASSAASLESNTKAITIDDAGQVYYEAFPVSMTELEDRLRNQQAQTPDFPVVVKGDGTVQYGKVVEVLDLLRRLDITKFGLVTGKAKG
ncbi:ExbD/TolR family protein [Sphingomonas lycopersici]|uniref:Biopolymer transporter ExbD n=1 Tax=Sphingomonas lycopersici TaxID=2951807 RepID=A0AA41Z668_9SPHN|nr:biopolymer transporter ExbD [Sphingomonas lycopersici]MCW6533648.1 biopolymer transporter ExbD [Sphingomonas lycopersici]